MEKYAKFKKCYDTFTGRLSSDPDIKFFDSGACNVKFSIPLKENKEDEATWLNCVAWGNSAQYISEFFHKGDEITVMGFFITEKYQDKEYIKFNVKIAQ